LLSFLSDDEERRNMQKAVTAVKLLKHDKLRKMVIDLETDGCYDQETAVARILDTLNNINGMIAKSFDVVSKQPALLPLYRQMIESAVATMPNARQFDAAMIRSFDAISDEFDKPDELETNPNAAAQNTMATIEQQKLAQDYDIKKEQNAIKREELNLKKAVAINKALKDD